MGDIGEGIVVLHHHGFHGSRLGPSYVLNSPDRTSIRALIEAGDQACDLQSLVRDGQKTPVSPAESSVRWCVHLSLKWRWVCEMHASSLSRSVMEDVQTLPPEVCRLAPLKGAFERSLFRELSAQPRIYSSFLIVY